MAFYVGKTNLGTNFYSKLVRISSELGMKPEDLLAVMVSESGIQNNIGEDKFRGGGLIGFMPDTQKMLGFKGTPEEFLKLNGEQQLDYVKRYVQQKIQYNGTPFKSAAQYYVANFFPIALKLPGIQQENPDTVFIEKNPETIRDPKTGRLWSKKYWDIGIKSAPEIETSAYIHNPLFWKNGSVQGAITYGDMMRQVDKNKSSSTYQKAISAMTSQTGYQPSDKSNNVLVMRKRQPTIKPSLEKTLDNYLQMVMAASHSYKKLYKKFLPLQHILIKINSNDVNSSIEFARVLCTALDTELLANAFTYTNGENIEIECGINGPETECFNTVNELSRSVSEAFQSATSKIGGISVHVECFMNKKSSYQPISIKFADINRRKFLLKFV